MPCRFFLLAGTLVTPYSQTQFHCMRWTGGGEEELGEKPPTTHVVLGVHIRPELHEPGGGLRAAAS